MNATLKTYWYAIAGSFWFLPALIAVVALALAQALVALDVLALDWALRDAWYYPSLGAEGSRALLTTIAGGMMTMASLVFSLTFVGLTLLSGQLGPRILMLFMHDKVTQAMLGVFVGVFLFALVTLSYVSEIDGGFVPHLTVTAAGILATLSFALVIFFVHHMANAIQADVIVADLGRRFLDAVERMGEAAVGDDAAAHRAARTLPLTGDVPVPAPSSGYVRYIDYASLLGKALDGGLVLELGVRSDDYVTKGLPLMMVSGPGADVDALSRAFTIGPRRDVLQDASYEARALVEIALRALSPGVNDPNTAVAAIDHLSAGLTALMRGTSPQKVLFDADGRACLVRPEPGLPYYLDLVVAALLPALRSDVLATERLIALLKTLERVARQPEHREAIAFWLGVVLAEIPENALPDALKTRLLETGSG